MSLSPQPTTRLKFLVVDDHTVVLLGTVDLLKQHYPHAEIRTAQTTASALTQVGLFQPDLVVLDLALPDGAGRSAQSEAGINLLRILMQQYPTLNLTVQSTHIKSLIRIRQAIDTHQGGFTTVDKGLSSQDMLTRIDWALRGVTHTKDLGTGLEMKPEWLDVLRLAFHEGLNDGAIAERMNVSIRTVRVYWSKLYDALSIYPENGKITRIQTEKRAREEGLID